MSEARVRAMRESDAGPITDLINWAIAETPAHFGTEPQTLQQTLDLFLATPPAHRWLTAEVDGRFAGYARSSVWNPRGAYAWSAEVSVYIRPEFHRRGIGRALYKPLFQHLRDTGFVAVMAGITLPNEASVRLHEAMGMRKVAHYEKVGYKFGAWRAVGYWQLILREDDGPPAPLRGA